MIGFHVIGCVLHLADGWFSGGGGQVLRSGGPFLSRSPPRGAVGCRRWPGARLSLSFVLTGAAAASPARPLLALAELTLTGLGGTPEEGVQQALPLEY